MASRRPPWTSQYIGPHMRFWQSGSHRHGDSKRGRWGESLAFASRRSTRFGTRIRDSASRAKTLRFVESAILQVGFDRQAAPPEIAGFGPRRFAGGARRAGRPWRRTRAGCPRRRRPAVVLGQTRAGRGGGTHRRDLRRPKGPKVSVLASAVPPHGQLSDPLHGAIQFRLHRIARVRAKASIPPIFLTPSARVEDLYAQLARQKLHRLVTQKAERPHACAPPSGWPSPVTAGKAWPHKRGRPSSPAFTTGPSTATFFSKLSVMFLTPWHFD